MGFNLLPNEKKIHKTKMSRKVFLKYYITSFILFASAVYAAFFVSLAFISSYVLGAFLLLVSAALSLFGEYRRGREIILMTTERILVQKSGQKGRGSKEIEAFPLGSITNISVNQNLKQRILGIGDIVFKLSMEEHVITSIDNPHEIESAIYKIIDREKELGMRK